MAMSLRAVQNADRWTVKIGEGRCKEVQVGGRNLLACEKADFVSRFARFVVTMQWQCLKPSQSGLGLVPMLTRWSLPHTQKKGKFHAWLARCLTR